MKRFATSDIHGCLKPFKALLKRIGLSKEDHLYILGDYVDRGPDSKGVIDYIWQLQNEGFQIFCLKGNHEQMMIQSLTDLEAQKHWLTYGGYQTLQSFNVNKMNEVPERYYQWMKGLPYYFEIEEFILVHAGLNFDVINPFDDKESMLWIRRWYDMLNKEWLNEKIIVHGHTPISREEICEMVKQSSTLPVIDIDAGCVFDKPGFGHLCALDLDTLTLYFEKKELNLSTPDDLSA